MITDEKIYGEGKRSTYGFHRFREIYDIVFRKIIW